MLYVKISCIKNEKCVGLYIWRRDMWYLKYTFKWLNHSFIPSISKTCRWHQGRHVGWSSKRISGDIAGVQAGWVVHSCASSISHQPGVFVICLLCSTEQAFLMARRPVTESWSRPCSEAMHRAILLGGGASRATTLDTDMTLVAPGQYNTSRAAIQSCFNKKTWNKL